MNALKQIEEKKYDTELLKGHSAGSDSEIRSGVSREGMPDPERKLILVDEAHR